MRLSLLLSVFFIGFAATQAHADLTLNYSGLTVAGSFLNGVAITPGTTFGIEADFNTVPFMATTGFAGFTVDSIEIEVGSASYTEQVPANFEVVLADPSDPIFGPFYLPVLGNLVDTSGLLPAFLASSNAGFAATAPGPTVFAGYVGSVQSGIDFSTSSGPLTVMYDGSVGVNASITPEPGLYGLLALGLAGVIFVRRQRTRQTE